MNAAKLFPISSKIKSLPNDFIDNIILAKNFIEY